MFNTRVHSQEWTTIVRGHQRRWYAALLITVLIAELALIWAVSYVPLNDLPIHTANAYIANHYKDVVQFERTYVLQRDPIPNSGLVLVMSPLMSIVSPIIAAKIFLSLSLILFIVGCHLLSDQIHGKPCWNTILCSFLFFSSALILGLLNYLLGLSLFLVTFSFWLRWRNTWSTLRVTRIVLLASLGYLVHLSSTILLAIAICLWSMQDLFERRNVRSAVQNVFLPLILPAILFFAFMSSTGSIGSFQYGSLYIKIAGLIGFATTYDRWMHWVVAVSLLVSIIVLWQQRTRIDFHKISLLVGGVFGVLWLVFPIGLFTGLDADLRFLLPAEIFLILSISLITVRPIGISILALLIIALCTRLVMLGIEWKQTSDVISNELQLFSALDTNARVYGVIGGAPESDESRRMNRGLSNVLSYAIITRHITASTHLAFAQQSPVAYRTPPYQVWTIERDWPRIFRENDYIWALNAAPVVLRSLDTTCNYIRSSGGVRLYRVRSAQAMASR